MTDPIEAPVCPRCGALLPPYSGRGRHRVWCSDECRRRARDERLAADGVAVPVRVEVRTDRVRIEALEHDLGETRRRLRAAERDRDVNLHRALIAEKRLERAAKERARLVKKDRAYREYLRGLPQPYRLP